MLVMDGREALLKSDEEDELIFDHTSLLNKEISFKDLSKKVYANGCKLQIARTINLCFSFFGLGLCFAIPTATLEDLKRSAGAGLDIRHIYTARYSGYLFGSLLGGFLFDRYNRQFLLFLSLLATSIGVIVMPFCSNVGSLMACTAITGITMGFLDTGGNVWCLDLWGRKSAPIMQTLHFCFGLGAFVAPLVAEPFLSPLYLDSSVGFEGNFTTGNATHRISHINFLHSGAPIKNLVRRAVDNGNLSFEILPDYEFSKYHQRNATDNSSDVVAFGNSTGTEMQQNVSTEYPDLLNTTSSTTNVPARTFKPKPQYADGNQLKTPDRWDRISDKIQSVIPNSNSTTMVTTSMVPLTTQHPESVSPRNDSEQNNSSNELLQQDDKGNGTLDSGAAADSQDSDNTTRLLENATLVSLPQPNTTQPTANSATKETSSTVGLTREDSSTLPGVLQNFGSPIQTQGGIGTPPTINTLPTTSKEPASTVSVTPPSNLQNGSNLLKGGQVETTKLKVGLLETTTSTQNHSHETEMNATENPHYETGMEGDNITKVSTQSNENVNSGTTTVVSPPVSDSVNSSVITSAVSPTISSTGTMSTMSSVASPVISSTASAMSTTASTTTSPTMLKQSFKFPKGSAANSNKNTDPKESVNKTSHNPAGTKEHQPALMTSTSPTNATDRQQHMRGSGMEEPDPISNASNFGENQLPDSTNSQMVSETTSSSSSVNGPPVPNHSQNPSSENETPNKPATQFPPLASSKETEPIEHLSTHSFHSEEHDLVTESDFERNSSRLVTSFRKSTLASQTTTLKATTVIENIVHPYSKSDPEQGVNQHKVVTASETLAENEVYPAEADRDIGENHRGVGINRVKNSNVLTAQDGDNFTEPVSGDGNNKGHQLDVLTDLFDALRKNRLGKFEIAYVILGLYVFVVAVVFLVFLCKNPREPRSRQLEELNKMREPSQCFTYTMVCLLSLFLCLYVGIEVAVGQVLQTFASMETLRLSTASGYFLSYLFWGSFAISRFVTIIISMKFSGFCILLTNLTICLVASIMLVAGADKIEALLWLGTVILGLGVGPLFPTAIAWVERYVHVTNKTASVFILGAALGEIVIPIIINAFINQEPMVLMYVNIIVNALCFISFVILSILAFRHGEKYLKKPKRSLYRLANMDDAEDGTELITNSFSNSNGTETGVKQRYRKLCT